MTFDCDIQNSHLYSMLLPLYVVDFPYNGKFSSDFIIALFELFNDREFNFPYYCFHTNQIQVVQIEHFIVLTMFFSLSF